MDKLASELHLRMASYLPGPDLCALRLTSKQLCGAAEEFLFADLILESNIRSLCRLQELGSLPMRKHLKRVIYSGLLLAEDDEFPFDHDVAAVDRRLQRGNFKYPANGDDHHLLAQYNAFVLGQRIVRENAMDCHLFQEELEKFPNLQELIFSSGHDGYRCRRFPAVQMSKIEVWKGSVEWKTLVRPDVKSGQQDHARQFEALLAAAYKNPRITTLRAVAIPLNILCNERYQDCCLSLASLRQLTLGFQTTSLPGVNPYLPAAIAQATRLERLRLSYGAVDVFCKIPLISLWKIVAPDLHLPSLRSLELEGFLLQTNQLAEFLKRHSSTLRSLGLRDLSLVRPAYIELDKAKSAWIWLIRFLEQSLGLERFRLSGQVDECGFSGPGWLAHNTDQVCACYRPEPTGGMLRHQIENFVVHGPRARSFSINVDQEKFWDNLNDGIREDCSWKLIRTSGLALSCHGVY